MEYQQKSFKNNTKNVFTFTRHHRSRKKSRGNILKYFHRKTSWNTNKNPSKIIKKIYSQIPKLIRKGKLKWEKLRKGFLLNIFQWSSKLIYSVVPTSRSFTYDSKCILIPLHIMKKLSLFHHLLLSLM